MSDLVVFLQQSPFDYATTVDADGSFVRPDLESLLSLEYYSQMTQLYLQAARLLPIAHIPDLARCITEGGAAIGLADPVTNIVLNTLVMFAFTRPIFDRVNLRLADTTTKKGTFFRISHDSREALVQFMVCYFRYLDVDQACSFLRMAGYDLVVAICLVEHTRCGGCRPVQSAVPDPDAARTKIAFGRAALQINKSLPTNLVRVMSSRYPRDLLCPLLDDIRGEKELSADRVHEICDMLRHPPPDCRDAAEASDILTASAVESRILSCMRGSLLVKAVRSTARGTQWSRFLKNSFLDTMHGFYIQALAMLPTVALREGHLIRAVLKAGHCYGIMDPVSNIILNSIWYDAAFPLSSTTHFSADQVKAADILDDRSLYRVESCSLDGLIAQLVFSSNITRQEAMVMIWASGDLSQLIQTALTTTESQHSPLTTRDKRMLVFAAESAKHPDPSALASFLVTLSPWKLGCLRSLLTDGKVINEDALQSIKLMLTKELAAIPAPVRSISPDLHQTALKTLYAGRSAFSQGQDFIRTELEKLLHDYGRDNPLGPRYKLGVVCGMMRATFYPSSACFHINFLASTQGDVPNDSTASSPACSRLFFAEFWNRADFRFEPSTKPSICCPVQDSYAWLGRCFMCERISCRIVHPPCGNHFIGTLGKDSFGNQFLVNCGGSDLGGMLESDFIYFDRERDVEFAKILNDSGLSVPY